MSLRVDAGAQGSGGAHVPRHVGDDFARAGYSGVSCNEGLLRFHDAESAPRILEHVIEAFPQLSTADVDAVAFDWNGRQLLSTAQGAGAEVELVIADIGAGTVEEFGTLGQFTGLLRHDEMVAQAFDAGLFEAWKQLVGGAGQGIAFADCVEFRQPLFLGGEATPENLELNDLDVAWSIGAQIWAQVRNLPPGAPVRINLG